VPHSCSLRVIPPTRRWVLCGLSCAPANRTLGLIHDHDRTRRSLNMPTQHLYKGRLCGYAAPLAACAGGPPQA
jgi:hypothetical protein